MGMSKMALYLNFSPKLMLNLGLLQLDLKEYFQSNNVITLCTKTTYQFHNKINFRIQEGKEKHPVQISNTTSQSSHINTNQQWSMVMCNVTGLKPHISFTIKLTSENKVRRNILHKLATIHHSHLI